MADEQSVFNGIDGASGEYLLPPMPPADTPQIALGETLDQNHLRELKAWHRRLAEKHFGPKEGVDPRKLDETGWHRLQYLLEAASVPYGPAHRATGSPGGNPGHHQGHRAAVGQVHRA